ncbi:MAG: DUF3552 domain-containing protein, partial [Oscillospiraceae bacterium]|nr:DUF3552 domain-containing protein [Oscillospiraceae bacterium]
MRGGLVYNNRNILNLLDWQEQFLILYSPAGGIPPKRGIIDRLLGGTSLSPLLKIIVTLAVAVILLVAAFLLGVLFRKKVSEREIQGAEEEAKRIVNEAIKSGENKKREALLEAKEEIHKNRTEYEREVKERRSELQKQERRLQQKEENLDKKTEALEKKKDELTAKLAA